MSSTTPSSRPLGCITCRRRKVKCDGVRPICSACTRLDRQCEWQDASTPRNPRQLRRPNDTACLPCRSRKIKCEGDPQRGACRRCLATMTECQWSSDTADTRAQLGPSRRSSRQPLLPTGGPLPISSERPPGPSSAPLLSPAQAETLVDSYFETVHHFGFFTFIHEMRFKRLLSHGKAPRELTMAMAANVLRFASEPTADNLALSDTLIDNVVGSLLARVLNGFGVIQLMTLLLVCQCEGHRGRTGSRWLLAALCVRMMQLMSLQILDHAFPSRVPYSALSPLLTHEALRRLAWGVFFMDSTLDGGRYGSGLIDVNAFRIQLPCNEQSFLGNDNTVTESIFAPPSERTGLSAYLIRGILLRRRALDTLLRLSHREYDVGEVQVEVTRLEDSITDLVGSLPARYHCTSDNMVLNRNRLPAFLLLHLLLHKLYMVLSMTKLSLYKSDPHFADLVPGVRRQRISHALAISGIFAEGLKYDLPFDPLASYEAYPALEVLLFEPRRLDIDPNAGYIAEAIPPLLAVLRQMGRRSEVLKVLHIEAVHRLLRCDWLPLLESSDLEAFATEYQSGQDEAEFNFRDFRFARIERLRSVHRPTSSFLDEPLLEYYPDSESLDNSRAASPRLDAAHIHLFTNPLPTSLDPPPVDPGPGPDFEMANPWLSLLNPMANVLAPTDNFSWLLGESDKPGLQSGDPTDFWRQLGL